jgi:predicted DNA-binding transcriptional regulator AlpA
MTTTVAIPDEPPERWPQEAAHHDRWVADVMLTISDIRRIFRLGKTAAYELTHRPEFPAPIPVSARCYRWWASEVDAYAQALRTRPRNGPRRTAPRPAVPGTPAKRITGTVRTARTSGTS